jgi:PAS domain S-box-containing protein
MSSIEVPVNGPEKSAPAPVGMITHLKHLIESLPVCVMRTDLDGCLLAANDSALQMLGVTEHAKVLSKSLSERISAEHAEDWRAFLQRSWTDGASSVECELIDFNGAHRIILVKSVAQPTHADGIQSLILTAQDQASRLRLERALNDHQACATTIDGLKAEVQRLASGHQRPPALVETPQAADGPESPAPAAEAVQQQVEELQRTLTARELELQNAIAAHDAERQQLAGLLEERVDEHQSLKEAVAARDAAHQAESDRLRARVAELEQSTGATRQEWQKRCDELTARLEEQDAERTHLSSVLEARDAEYQRLSALLEQQQAEHQQLSGMLEARAAEHQAAGEALQQRVQELQRTASTAEHELQKRSDDLTAQLAEHAAARLQLTNLLTRRDADLQADDHAHQERIDELERSLKTKEDECRKLRTEPGGTSDTLQQRLDELQRTLKTNEEAWQQARATLESDLAKQVDERDKLSVLLRARDAEQHQLSESLKERDAEHRRLSEILKEREDDQHRLSDSLNQRDIEYRQQTGLQKQLEEERERLLVSLQQRDTEQHRLLEALDQHKREQRRLTDLLTRQKADHGATVEALQQQIVEFERGLTANDEAWKHRCEELSAELAAKGEERTQRWQELSAQAAERAAETRRLSELLELSGAAQKRLVAEWATEKVRLEQSVRDGCERAAAAVEEQRRRETDSLRLEIRHIVDDLQRTATELERRTNEHDQLLAAATAPRDANAVIDPAYVDRLMKSLAAHRIELVQVTENTIRTLEPMATAGRVAIAASRELQDAIESVDARSRTLLAQCGLDDLNRPEIENLRRDSIAAASLVRQLAQVFGESTRVGAHTPERVSGETA